MDNEEIKILNTASSIFFKKGFTKTPVDEIALALKMSKKTIYKHFPSKDSLITAVIMLFLKTHSINIKSIMDSDKNAVEKIFTMTNYIGNQILKINDKWFYDISEYSEDLWGAIEKFRFKVMNENIAHVLEQGIKEGLIVDKPVIILLNVIIFSIRAIVNPEFILKNKLVPSEALKNTIEIVMCGMLTDKGKKVHKKLILENI